MDNGRFLKYLKSLFSFQGRIGRAEYWIIHLVVAIVARSYLRFIDAVPGVNVGLSVLIFTVLIWLTLASSFRRAHDLNLKGWLSFLFYIPVINIGLIIYFGFFKGTDGPNRFG